MILPLRNAHRKIWMVMLLALPFIVASAVASRANNVLPGGPACERSSQATLTILEPHSTRTVLLPASVTDAPDVLIYSSTGSEEISNAVFISRFRSGLTVSVPPGSTSLFFYSAARRETVFRLEVQP